MSHLNIRFPIDISYGAAGGPEYSTDIAFVNSGHEQRQQNWASARCYFDVSRTITNDTQRNQLLTHFRIAKGRTHSFPFRDFTDYTVSGTEGILIAIAGSTYQLYKRYTSAGGTEDRLIALPLAPLILAGIVPLTESVDYTLDLLTGIVTMLGSPTQTPTSWSGQFDVPCRFDTDRLTMVAEDIRFFRTQQIPIVEVRYP